LAPLRRAGAGRAFGKPVASFQNTRFELAEMDTEVDVTRAYVDRCLRQHVETELSPADAAKAKWWASDVQKRVVDRCVQLHGGYGHMLEYPIARAFVDSRVQSIYGGTNEIMKEIIGRALVGCTDGPIGRLGAPAGRAPGVNR
jgi:alkylation response protein AidB-like acyl-CoA dehydrogenase